MSDDATQGDWQPLADQPVLPEETTAPGDPDVVWAQPPDAAPRVGPGMAIPHNAAFSPSTAAIPQPPPDVATSLPSATEHAAELHGDYLEAPPRRRPPLAGLVGLVVIGALILAGLAFAIGGGSRSTTSTGVDSATSKSATPLPAGGSLEPYLLTPADVGPGTSMTLVPGGRALSGANGVTLDFCGDTFPSEKLRVDRVQAQYAGPAGTASNEFVRYDPGGADAAFKEITKAVSTCGTGYQDATGAVSNIQRPSGLRGLAPHHTVVSFEQQVSGQGTAHLFWVTCVYQFDGDFFSGVYVYSADSAAGLQLAQSLATKAAGYLQEAASGNSGTGGGVFSSGSPGNAPGLAA